MEPKISEVKEAIDKLAKDWHDYKEANDVRLAEVEKKGSADPVTTEKVAKLEASLATFEDLNQAVTKVAKQIEDDAKAREDLAKEFEKSQEEVKKSQERLEEVESALRRVGTNPGPGETEAEKKAREDKDLFLNWCRLGDDHMKPDELKLLKEYKKLTLGDDTQAGYLAPVEYVREIIKGAVVFSPIRTIARVRSTSAKEIQIPRRTGQFAAQWVAEQGTRSETTGLTYGLETLPTHELYALVDISEALLEDSVFNLEAELEMEFSEQFGVAEGAAFVTGNGAGRPEGFMDHASVSSDVSGSAATIQDSTGQANGLITLQHNLKEAYATNATWVLNRKTIGAIRQLKDGQNNYIWQPGNLASGIPNTILGNPYVEATDMPNEAANAFPIAFGDFRRAYTIVDRIVMSVLRDPFTQATTGAVRFIARRRVGGQVVLAEAIRKLKCST
ncbi:MAG: phage major capsid protein [Candidatus Methylomirabilales bacterium]